MLHTFLSTTRVSAFLFIEHLPAKHAAAEQ